MKRQGNDDSRELSSTDADEGSSRRASASESNKGAVEEMETSEGPEFLKDLPPEARKSIEIGMMSMHRVGPAPNPLTEKLNEGHIDKILDLSAKSEERLFQETSQSRRFTLLYALIFAALFIFLTIFLVQADKDLYKEALKLFAVFGGGFGGGFGMKSYLDRGKRI
uniref:Uncharacterized protein n=1 Tax=Candidatus Kentrum sp. LFY TaxID=2126342 RepID=A0A450U9V6_9GAMM|nr:MAG: hypothetical protein BECKLFY1418B_GA0070995_101219 [Candidatus Kentron sp. LFY]